MIDTQLPCALIVSDFADPEIIASEILKDESFPKANSIAGNIRAYPWSIDTKYYKATIHLCPIEHDTLLPEAVLSCAEAVVFYFDSKNAQSFDNAKKWCADLEDDLPEILLLVCDGFEGCPESGVQRIAAVEWCSKNGFELIELNGTESDENDDYAIIPEKVGADRIIEALQAHVWPNMDMKPTAEPKMKAKTDSGDPLDDFCELFSQLRSMKESIDSLPAQDKRLCAEQVVSNFWKAIGGDDDELDDLEE